MIRTKGLRQGRSTGTPTKSEAARMAAIKEGGCVIPRMVAVPGIPHAYAGDDGSIWSDHPRNRWRGKSLIKYTPADNGRGYLRVRCHGKSRCVHILVAATYLGPKPEGKEVNHIDGDKLNNRPENLEYVTRAENMQHCFRMGLMNPAVGERHHMTSMTAQQVATLRHDYIMLRDGLPRMPRGSMKHLQQKYNVTDSCINGIVRRVTWK